MIVLGLDTSGPLCSVSIVDEATVLANICHDIGRGHAEVLAGMVADALEQANLTPNDIDRLAVCTGPGSFTGLRVALSFALGFALPRSLPVVGLDALEVTAFEHDPMFQNRVAVQQDIRRGEFFYALYEYGKPIVPPQAMAEAEVRPLARSNNVDEVFDARVDTRILAWLSIDRDPDAYPPHPLYSRGPDAKLPGGKSLADRVK